MPNRRRAMTAALGAWPCLPIGVGATPPPAARPERVRVLSTTDRPSAQPLIEAFESHHPRIAVDYHESGSADIDARLRARGPDGAADVVWSSAMDLQIKLVNDGFAARHASVEAAGLPRWAVWKHEAYGTNHEPVGLLVQRELLATLPRHRSALTAWLTSRRAQLQGRVATYDITRSGLGYLLAAQDLLANAQHWELLRALGLARARLHADTQGMLQSVADRQVLLAYNVLGSYAEAFALRHPQVAVVYLDDYTLVATRVAFVTRNAANPAAARRWLDHLLSAGGQRVLSQGSGLYPIRANLGGVAAAASAPVRALRPITLGPGLLAHLDHSKRQSVMRRWHAVMTAG